METLMTSLALPKYQEALANKRFSRTDSVEGIMLLSLCYYSASGKTLIGG